MKKLALALYVTSRKLRHYFQSFSITILIEHPLRSITETPEATWRITKWTSELNPYGVKYEPRTMINGQVLANFITKFTLGALIQSDALEGWILNIGRALNNKRAGVRLFLITLEGSIIEQSFTVGFTATTTRLSMKLLLLGSE